MPCYLSATTVTTQTEIPSQVFIFRGVTPLNSPVVMSLQNDEVDLSTAIQGLERSKKSHYDSIFDLDDSHTQIQEHITNLCQHSKTSESCINNANTKLQEAIDKIKEELSQNIVYPESYTPIGQSGGQFKLAMNLLDSDCINQCNSSAITMTITLGPQEEYAQIYDKLRTKNNTCLEKILRNIQAELENEMFPKKCLQENNRNHPVCKSMSRDVDILRARVLGLTELTYGLDTEKVTEANALCTNCTSRAGNGNEHINMFTGLIDDLQEQVQCFELKPGKEKTVYSNTGRDRSYRIKREPDNSSYSYVIPLNLQFSADEDYDGEVPRDQVPIHYIQRVQDCIKEANEKMLGPNGEKLKIVIQTPTEQVDKNCIDDVKTIKVGSKEHRSNSGKYEADIDCETITHEILHLLGLCDEYIEQLKGHYIDSETGERRSALLNRMEEDEELMNSENYDFKPAFDCRATTENSIMSNHYDRWTDVFDYETYNSLLTPGQFNAILYGACKRKNELFNECSQLAYQNTIDTGIDCLEKRDQCMAQNFSGKSKQEEIDKLQARINAVNFYIRDYRSSLQEVQERGESYIGELDFWQGHVEREEKLLKELRKKLKLAEAWP